MARPLAIALLASALILPGVAGATLLGVNPDPLVAGALQAELVGIVAGVPVGGVVLEGAVAPGDVTLVFRPTFLPTEAELNPIHVFAREGGSLLAIAPSGGGAIAGAGRDVLAVERDPFLVDIRLLFRFEPGIHPSGVEGDLIFAAFPALADRDILGVGVSSRRPGAMFGRTDIAWARVVPEPALGFAALAAGLALRARRRVIG